MNKDETVYGFLDASGSVKDVRVVNRLIRSDGGTWVDWGNYLSVRAMEADLAPDFSPGRVVWDLSAIADMRAGFSKLQAGSKQQQEGVAASADGSAALVGKTSSMPGGAKKLADGQRELTAGLTTLREQTSGLLPGASDPSGTVISFADGKTAIHSLQYVLRMDGIPAPDKVKTEGPREIRIPWYEELWNRLTGLF